ncbi:MAG: riboflavin synthase [Candidatus Eisenbacteria bacterium]|uniref:Riboflavin synthase n=1 Tax=Eiseniibacteriota bacterium TaxID=2212470 RepID=A0A849SKP2_UNCEI|nr:riboflavin synthase [Candidatus Eisenbacteria bacterium]
MFTGLVETVGVVQQVEERPGGRRFWIASAAIAAGAALGDSIAINGCCLTAIAIEPQRFAVEAVPETLARSTVGSWTDGTRVNLERALRLDQRLGGHLVQGHVDGAGEVIEMRAEGEGRRLILAVPGELSRFVAFKGSLAVDGVSLTIASVTTAGCEIALIPHTLAATVAGEYRAGSRVNLEVDLLARYVARLLETTPSRESSS